MVDTSKARLHYLDALRGIAALAVVIFHYTLDMVDQHVLADDAGSFPHLIGDDLNLGKYGVVLFFLISGYIIPNSLGPTRDRVGRFCVSRFFRLYPFYWVAVAFGIFLPWPLTGTIPSSGTIFANLTMIQGYLGFKDIVGSAWTLQIELLFYAACVALAAANRMTSPRSCALASIGCLLIALVMAFARGMLLKKLPVALPLALSLMFFGTVWRQATLNQMPEAKTFAKLLLSAIVVLIVPISLMAYNHDYGYHERWQPYVTCYLLAIMTFLVCTTRVLITWRPLVWLGTISYSLYLMHPLVASAAYQAGFTAAEVKLPPQAYLALLTGLSVLSAWATYTLIERPCTRLGHSLIGTFGQRTVAVK